MLDLLWKICTNFNLWCNRVFGEWFLFVAVPFLLSVVVYYACVSDSMWSTYFAIAIYLAVVINVFMDSSYQPSKYYSYNPKRLPTGFGMVLSFLWPIIPVIICLFLLIKGISNLFTKEKIK